MKNNQSRDRNGVVVDKKNKLEEKTAEIPANQVIQVAYFPQVLQTKTDRRCEYKYIQFNRLFCRLRL